jgi:hypothetical protein
MALRELDDGKEVRRFGQIQRVGMELGYIRVYEVQDDAMYDALDLGVCLNLVSLVKVMSHLGILIIQNVEVSPAVMQIPKPIAHDAYKSPYSLLVAKMDPVWHR